MKNQALISSRVKVKNSKCRLLQFLFGALRVTAKQRLEGKQSRFRSSGSLSGIAFGSTLSLIQMFSFLSLNPTALRKAKIVYLTLLLSERPKLFT